MLILPSAYLAPVQYYARLYAADGAVEDRGERYVKQTYRNRCYIATPQGPQALIIPVERDGASHSPMRDVRLSDHGEWRRLHRTALVTAYESTPYFEYYADDILPLYERDFHYLVDFNDAFRNVVLNLLELERPITVSEEPHLAAQPGDFDQRPLSSPKPTAGKDPQFRAVPYYQVFADRAGFLPNLSIADLLFHMGPESRLVLRQSLVREE